jgi:AAA family ATP:ADP antiporter
LVFVTGLISTLVDLQYKWVLDERFADSEVDIIRFCGALLGTSYLISALVQILATGQILRKFGLRVALAILPAGMVAGSLGIIFTASFWSVVLAKAIEGSLRSSIEQTSTELLYVPIASRQTIAIKSFMELVVFRFGDGLGAALFLGVLALVETPVTLVGALLLIIVLTWLYVTGHVGEEYVNVLRRSLEVRGPRTVQRALELNEAVAESSLVKALGSPHPRKVRFAIEQLEMRSMETDLGEMVSGDFSGDLFSMQVAPIYQSKTEPPRWLEAVEKLVEHPDHRVAATALHLMIGFEVHGYKEQLQEQLQSASVPAMRYLFYLERHAYSTEKLLDPRNVMAWCEKASPAQAISLAYVLGNMRNRRYLPVLRSWLAAPNLRLRRAAIRAIGRQKAPEDVSTLVQHLANNWSRSAAKRALREYGDAIVPQLSSAIQDPRTEIGIKRELPNILTRINTPSSRNALLAALYSHDSIVSYRALKGLNRLRSLGGLSFDEGSFIPLLQIWAKEYYGLLNVDLLLHTSQAGAVRLLQKAIKERLNWSIEKIFRGLDLFLPRGDAYFSYLGFTSPQQDLKETAIELVDSRVRGELRQTLLPIFAELHRSQVVAKGREIFKLPDTRETALSELFFHGDPWLKCCTIGAVAADRMGNLKQLVQQAREDINPMVRETARWALAEWDRQNPDERI